MHTEPENMLDIALAALPLRITRAEPGPDPILLLGGPGWSSNFTCNWILVGDGYRIDRDYRGENVPDDEEDLVSDDLIFLIGRNIEGITSNQDMIDPVFHISGGVDLIVHADSDLDPWVLGLPHITLVGSAHPSTG